MDSTKLHDCLGKSKGKELMKEYRPYHNIVGQDRSSNVYYDGPGYSKAQNMLA